MEYWFSGKESLWNRHVCHNAKCAAGRPSRWTGVDPSRKQRCCSQSCLLSQAQWDTSNQDNSENLDYWLTIVLRHRYIDMWSWTEVLTASFQPRAKTVWIHLCMSTEVCRLGEGHNWCPLQLCPLECRLSVGKTFPPEDRENVVDQKL